MLFTLKKKIIWLLPLLLRIHLAPAQSEIKLSSVERTLHTNRSGLLEDEKFSFGFSIGLAVEFGQANTSQLRGSFGAGASKALGLTDFGLDVVPSYQIELQIYRGGLGSSLAVLQRNKVHAEVHNNFAFYTGYSRMEDYGFKYIAYGRPMLKIVGNSYQALYDPFDVSIGFGSTFVTGINHNRNQQIGTFILGIHNFQAAYYNDGPFFNYKVLPLGDAYDRYWTGGGQIGIYRPDDKSLVTEIVAKYDKYTGWQPNAYEVASLLGIDYVPYSNIAEALYNQGRWSWSAGFKNNLQISYNRYEPQYLDVQNLIHRTIGQPFHQVQLKKHWSMAYSYRAFNLYNF